MPYLKLSAACLAYGHVPLLDHADFQLDPGERVALIGRNGTGKSSLLAALAAGTGRGRLDDGEVWAQPGIRVGYVPQEPPFDPAMNVFQAVVSGMGETSALLADYHDISHQLAEGQGDHDALLARMDTLQHELEARGAWAYEAQAERVIDRFGLDPEASVGSLSGGQKKRLALAQARGYSSHLIDQLQQLAMRGHQQFYRHRSHLGAQIIRFVIAGFPQLVRHEWRAVLAGCLLFFGALIGMGLLTYLFPELIYSLIAPEQVREMERMYDPGAQRIGRFAERDSGDDWMMFGFYIMNNIGIAFQTFASGLIFGLGSLFFLLYNGLVIGAIAGHLTRIGYSETFWSFVIGHGAFELTAIAFAGAAGFKLGWALLAPGRLPRGEALRRAARQAIQLGYLPRLHIKYTSKDTIGQIYVPSVNLMLYLAVVVLVYRQTSNYLYLLISVRLSG